MQVSLEFAQSDDRLVVHSYYAP